jgi:hypothetical protein
LRSNPGSKLICRTDLVIFLDASLNAGFSMLLFNMCGPNGGAVDVNGRFVMTVGVLNSPLSFLRPRSLNDAELMYLFKADLREFISGPWLCLQS